MAAPLTSAELVEVLAAMDPLQAARLRATLAARDATLAARDATLAVKDEEIEALKSSIKHRVREYIKQVGNSRITDFEFVLELAKRAGINGLAGADEGIKEWLRRFNDGNYIKLDASAAEYVLQPWDAGFLQEFAVHFPFLPRIEA